MPRHDKGVVELFEKETQNHIFTSCLREASSIGSMASSQFQKMIVIPEQATAQMASTVKSTESHPARLNQEMQRILQRTDIAPQEEWITNRQCTGI